MIRPHWTPAYVAARIRLHLFERTHADAPWWPRPMIEIMDQLVRPSDVGLEWGSGRSTRWLGRRIASLTSVEEDETWAARTREAVKDLPVELLLLPKDRYVGVVDRFADASLDLCVVDGDMRDACAKAALPKLKPGGMLFIDDVQRYLASAATRTPYGLKEGFGSEMWHEVWLTIGSWRAVRLGNGVTESAVFFKP